MSLREIIRIAGIGYNRADPTLLMRAHDGKDVGDGLAKFIVSELKETYDPKNDKRQQLSEAMRVIGNAVKELIGVHRIFNRHWKRSMKGVRSPCKSSRS